MLNNAANNMKTIHNLETLKTFGFNLLQTNLLTLNTGRQSFNVYPTEHVEIAFSDHNVSIEVGSIVYGNLSIK